MYIDYEENEADSEYVFLGVTVSRSGGTAYVKFYRNSILLFVYSFPVTNLITYSQDASKLMFGVKGSLLVE